MDPLQQTPPSPAGNASPSPAHGAGEGDATPASLTAEMEREIAEAMDDLAQATDAHSVASRAAQAKAAAREAHSHDEPLHAGAKPKLRGPRVVRSGREHRHGKVVSVGPTDIFIEFGPKELGVCPRMGWPEDALPKTGDDIEVVVDRYESSEQLFICSRPGAVQKAEWEMLEPGQLVEARVVGVNKGGLELEVANHRAFMPASQIDTRRIEDLSVFVGEKMTCEVQKVERTGKGNIVLSRRNLLKEERAKQGEKLREELAEGQTREGVVRKLMPFGAFIDLGGVDGLLHVSDMSYDRVGDPSKVLKEGQTINVRVLKLDWENNKISLGLKQLQGDPFATATEAVAKGAEVTGRVTKIAEFGAFIEVAPASRGCATSLNSPGSAWPPWATCSSPTKCSVSRCSTSTPASAESRCLSSSSPRPRRARRVPPRAAPAVVADAAAPGAAAADAAATGAVAVVVVAAAASAGAAGAANATPAPPTRSSRKPRSSGASARRPRRPRISRRRRSAAGSERVHHGRAEGAEQRSAAVARGRSRHLVIDERDALRIGQSRERQRPEQAPRTAGPGTRENHCAPFFHCAAAEQRHPQTACPYTAHMRDERPTFSALYAAGI